MVDIFVFSPSCARAHEKDTTEKESATDGSRAEPGRQREAVFLAMDMDVARIVPSIRRPGCGVTAAAGGRVPSPLASRPSTTRDRAAPSASGIISLGTRALKMKQVLSQARILSVGVAPRGPLVGFTDEKQSRCHG